MFWRKLVVLRVGKTPHHVSTSENSSDTSPCVATTPGYHQLMPTQEKKFSWYAEKRYHFGILVGVNHWSFGAHSFCRKIITLVPTGTGLGTRTHNQTD